MSRPNQPERSLFGASSLAGEICSRAGLGDSVKQHWLVECLRSFPVRAAAARLEPHSERDWVELVALAGRHGVIPLLYRQLATDESPLAMPDGVLQTLREAYLMNRAKNALLYHELAQVLEALRQDNIPVIVLKGAHLAASVYGDMALRTMNDIDLMVGRNDLERTASRLRDLGYVAPHSLADVAAWCQKHRHMPRMSKPPCPGIEIHWTIAAPSLFGGNCPAGLWERSRSSTIAGVSTRVLSPEDLLLHVSLHTARDSGGPFRLGLSPLCDLAAVVRYHANEIRWQQLVSRAFEWQEDKSVYLALRLAKELLAAGIPDAVLESLRPKDFDEQWAALAANQVFLRGTACLPPEAVSASGLLRAFRSQPWRGKVRWLFRTAFPSRDQMAGYMAYYYSLPLNPIRNYTCYLTRALDWLTKATRLVWHALAHRGLAAGCARQVRNETRFCQWLYGTHSGSQSSDR